MKKISFILNCIKLPGYLFTRKFIFDTWRFIFSRASWHRRNEIPSFFFPISKSMPNCRTFGPARQFGIFFEIWRKNDVFYKKKCIYVRVRPYNPGLTFYGGSFTAQIMFLRYLKLIKVDHLRSARKAKNGGSGTFKSILCQDGL